MARPAVGVGLILMDPRGWVLLGRRVKAGEEPTWCLPGGHVEGGETIEQAAAREAAEEAGIGGTQPEVIAIGVQTTGSGMTAAAVAPWPGTPPRALEPDVLTDWGWYAPDELPEPLYPPHQPRSAATSSRVAGATSAAKRSIVAGVVGGQDEGADAVLQRLPGFTGPRS